MTARDGSVDDILTPSHEMRRYLRTLVKILDIERKAGNPWGTFPKNKNFFEKIKRRQEALKPNAEFNIDEGKAISALGDKLSELVDARSERYATLDFYKEEVDELFELMSYAHTVFGGNDQDILPIDADIPREFSGNEFLRSIEANAELMGVSDYVETMLMRVRTLLGDSRMKSVSGDVEGITLAGWLEDYIGANEASNGSVTVIDLSLLPVEVVHLVTAVIARITLEALQRYRKVNQGKILPTALVMEEAHTFIKRYNTDTENQNSAAICCQVFEKIAREGRKFGLGLVLSSQRPSELSPTVLSQCNSFLLHRTSNDRDRDLPSLPSRHAILMGWASELPVLVKMNALAESERPTSADPDFWNVWSGLEELQDGNPRQVSRPVDWNLISRDWQERSESDKK